MLIIPLDRPIDWRRPPLVVLALVLANVLIHLGLQLDDRRAEAAAFHWYHDSGLADIELPRYRDWLVERGHADRVADLVAEYGDDPADPASPWLRHRLDDGEFQQALAAGEIVRPEEEIHDRWRSMHAEFHRRLEQSTSMAWGLRPADPGPATWLTHMFLHADPVHLVGNMVFLVAVGFLVEMALGSLIMLGLYALAGLGAAAMFVLLNPVQGLPLVGASGAIAGLMGLLAVVYGMQRIRFFYFIGVYFDYVKAPALVLLPLWLGYELYQFLTADAFEPIAYSAHIGGLVTGAVVATGIRFGTSLIDQDYIREREREERLREGLETVREALRTLRPEPARPALRRLQAEFAGEPRVLQAAYELARLEPDGDSMHAAARAILEVPGDDVATRQWVLATWRDYRGRARPRPRVSATAMDRLADLLLVEGAVGEAAALIRPMLKRPDRFPRPAELACRLATLLEKTGEREQARGWYSHVARTWPATDAGRTAARVLQGT